MVIYGLYDPRKQPLCIHYVGYTGKAVSRRLVEHVSNAKSGTACHRANWIRSLLADGVKPAIIVLEAVTAETWQIREQHWIAELPGLTNSTAGGEGLIRPSAAVKARISKSVSASLIGNTRRTDIPHSAEAKAKISAGLLSSEKMRQAAIAKQGKPLSAIATERAARYRRGRPLSESHKAKIRLASLGCAKTTGYRWFNNGKEERLAVEAGVTPQGFSRGRLAGALARATAAASKTNTGKQRSSETRQKISAGHLALSNTRRST